MFSFMFACFNKCIFPAKYEEIWGDSRLFCKYPNSKSNSDPSYVFTGNLVYIAGGLNHVTAMNKNIYLH